MSRAISGLAISVDRSAMRFSSSDISASIVSGSRGFLMIFTRVDGPAAADFRRRDPSAVDDCPDLVFFSLNPPANAGTDFKPSRVDAAADLRLDSSCCALPFDRAARQ